MIRNSKQNWEVGATVKVGFMTLQVRAAVATPGDYLPDAYILSNLAGDKLYSFVPHNGLTSITADEAREMISQCEAHADRFASAALAKAAAVCEVNAIFA